MKCILSTWNASPSLWTAGSWLKWNKILILHATPSRLGQLFTVIMNLYREPKPAQGCRAGLCSDFWPAFTASVALLHWDLPLDGQTICLTIYLLLSHCTLSYLRLCSIFRLCILSLSSTNKINLKTTYRGCRDKFFTAQLFRGNLEECFLFPHLKRKYNTRGIRIVA